LRCRWRDPAIAAYHVAKALWIVSAFPEQERSIFRSKAERDTCHQPISLAWDCPAFVDTLKL
jgi:hypothetical protein